MNPRQAILDLLKGNPDILSKLVEKLALPPGDLPTSERLQQITECPEATTSLLLSHLNQEQLRQVSSSCGLLSRGDPKDLRDRIGKRSSFEPQPGGKRRGRGSRSRAGTSWRYQGEPFVAIDFETADRHRDSACAVALVRVEDGFLQRTESRLIRPPRKRFEFTHIHGITWEQVRDAPDFREVWEDLEEILEGVDFLAAHNAPFDRSVLETCCRSAGLLAPSLPFQCTVRLARSTWTLRRARLPDVCGLLGIPLIHHDATSDAQACARIVLESRKAHSQSEGETQG